MKKYIWLIFFILFSEKLMATPSGADLLSACETSLETGFNGETGMMCVWYVTPCDCHHGKDSEIPRVCLPDGKKPESLAREVIDGLKSQPELQGKSAEISAGEILAVKYPCD
jgi:Ssp1 endopeptidase immunity protein Rap1a